MSGGKGGSSTSSVEIPEYIEAAAQRNLGRAEDVSRMGYVPQYGPQVAALTPMEEAAAQNVAGAASAFGMATPTGADVYGGIGAPTEYAGGVRGYSSVPLYEQSLAQLQADRPAQYDYMQSFFIDPATGQSGARALPPINYGAPQVGMPSGGGNGGDGGSNLASGSMMPQPQFRPDNFAGSRGMTTARENSFGADLSRSLSDPNYDPAGNVVSRALGITKVSDKDGDGRDDSGSGGDGCVVATHAVSSGAFTPSMKREAVVWCMHNLHDKWWGEAIRRGYRHLGKQKIAEGKAHEHYQEFRDYINFASGKKRTIKGAIHFAARTVQFFAVGLIKGDA